MKKWGRRFVWCGAGVVLFFVLFSIGLQVVSRTEWFKDQVSNALKNALGRDIQLADMGINWRGIFVKDLQIAEKGGFEKGVFAQMGHLRVRISWIHLLHGHTKMELIVLSDAKIKLIAYADGTTSWGDWAQEETENSETNDEGNLPVEVTASHVRLERLHFIYVDEKAAHTWSMQDVNAEVQNFSFKNPFSLKINGDFSHEQATKKARMPFHISAFINLKNLNFAQAYLVLEKFSATYQKAGASLSGRVDDFINPKGDLSLKVNQLSADTFRSWVKLPEFSLPEGTLQTQINANLEKQNLTFPQISLNVPGLSITGKGDLSYGKQTAYNFALSGEGELGKIGRWFTLLAEPYRAVGNVQLQAKIAQKKLEIVADVQEVGGLVAQQAHLANLNGHIAVSENLNWQGGQADVSLEGKLNANPFTLNLTAKQTAQKIKAKLQAYAKELSWKQVESKQTTADADPAEKSSFKWPLPPIDLITDIKFDKVDVPYFYATQASFSSDLQGITPDLKQAHGTLRLVTSQGKILDLYKLTNANPLTKVLFMSLNVTGKVFNSLNVLGVLNSIGSGIASAVTSNKEDAEVKTQTILGPDGEPLEVTVVQSKQKISGTMEYDKFDTQVDFVDGKATVKEGTFVSTMMSLRLDGTTDFNTGVLNLTVHAAPGRHEVDGMLPLTLKIGGTIEEPQGNMQVLGSVASLLKQSVTNNVVSRNVTKGVKGFFGLFTNKEEVPQETVVETAD